MTCNNTLVWLTGVITALNSLFHSAWTARLLPQVFSAGDSFVQDALLALQSLQLHLEQADVLHPLAVVEVSLAQDGLLDPDFLIQQGPLIVVAEQLFAQTVPLSDDLQTSFRDKSFC